MGIAQDSLPGKYLDPVEVSEVLDVPVETLYAWRKRKYGPPAARIGRHLRYDPAKVQAWVDSRTA